MAKMVGNPAGGSKPLNRSSTIYKERIEYPGLFSELKRSKHHGTKKRKKRK